MKTPRLLPSEGLGKEQSVAGRARFRANRAGVMQLGVERIPRRDGSDRDQGSDETVFNCSRAICCLPKPFEHECSPD